MYRKRTVDCPELLLFLLVRYETSFDLFHAKKDLIYRVISINHDAKGGGALQFVIAQVLITGVLVIVSQMHFFRHADLGFVKDAVVTVPVPRDSASQLPIVAGRMYRGTYGSDTTREYVINETCVMMPWLYYTANIRLEPTRIKETLDAVGCGARDWHLGGRAALGGGWETLFWACETILWRWGWTHRAATAERSVATAVPSGDLLLTQSPFDLFCILL